MSATTKEPETEIDKIDKFTKGLLSTIAYLMGFREDVDGKLNVTVSPNDDDSRSCVSIENVNTQTAQQWEAGALLNTVANMNYLSTDKIQKIRKEIGISTGGRIVARPVSVEPSPDSSNSGKSNPVIVGTTSVAKTFNQEDPFALSKGPAGFYPPRKVASTSSNNSAKSDISTELMQRKQFTFAKPKTVEELSLQQIQNNETFSRTSLFESPPRKKPTLERPADVFPSESNMSYQNSVSAKNGRGNRWTGAPNTNQINEDDSKKGMSAGGGHFMTANQKLIIDDKRKGIQRTLPSGSGTARVPGLSRPPPKTTPLKAPNSNTDEEQVSDNPEVQELMTHESMKNIDAKMVETILNEIVQVNNTEWDDIAGLDNVKQIIREIIVWPMQRPDIFFGLRAAPHGILFFGPPGTGKTMFGRVIATQSNSTFFNITASTLTSKWIGEGEKQVRALFAVARLKQPSVIFIDEIDSILTQRSDTENESTRRLKTEFLIQFDGCTTSAEDRVLVIGVTNRPQELDEAARRRLVKRIYIPLPDKEARGTLVKNLIKDYSSNLTDKDFEKIAKMTKGYSGADMTNLCREAAYGPLREMGPYLQHVNPSDVRSVQMNDFVDALKQVKSSVDTKDVKVYEEWNSKFGCQVTTPTPDDSSQLSQSHSI